MKRKKGKEGIQLGLSEQEMHKPVDLRKEPPQEVKVERAFGLHIPYGVSACPNCGGRLILRRDGRRGCEECYVVDLDFGKEV